MTTPTAPEDWIQDFLNRLPEGDETTCRVGLYNHLSQAFQPASGPERLKVQEMALAWLELGRLQMQAAGLKSLQCSIAEEEFERLTRNRYEKLSRELRKSPLGNYKALSENAIGLDFLIDRCQPVVEKLKTNQPIDLEHMLEALLATGFSDNIRHISEIGLQLMAWFLKLQPEPKMALARWLVRSGLKNRETHELYGRTNQAINEASDPEIASLQLCGFFSVALEQLLQLRQNLAPEHLRQRQLYAQAAQPDRMIISSLRTLESFRKVQLARLLKLEKELHALKRQRLRDDQIHAEHQARLEAIRNGTALPRRSSKPTLSASAKTPESDGLSPIIDMFSTTCTPNHPAHFLPEITPSEAFPEMELIQAVQQSAEQLDHNPPAVSTHDYPSTNAPEPSANARSKARPDLINQAQQAIAQCTDAELANPRQHAQLNQIFNKANRNQKIKIERLIEWEKADRQTLPSYQPSG